MIKNSLRLITLLSSLTILHSFAYASYSFKITVKFPYHNRWVNPGEKIVEEAWIPDVCGRLVHRQDIIKSRIGLNEVLIRPEGLSAGVYFVRLETEGYNKTQKAILLR